MASSMATASGERDPPVDPRLALLAKKDPVKAAEIMASQRASTSSAAPAPAEAVWSWPSDSTTTARQLRQKKVKSSIQRQKILDQQQLDLVCTWCRKRRAKRLWFSKNQWNQDKPLCRVCAGRRDKEYDDLRFDRELDVDEPGESGQDKLDASLARAKMEKAASRGITDEDEIAAIRLTKAEVRAAEDAVHNAAPISASAYFEKDEDDLFDYDD